MPVLRGDSLGDVVRDPFDIDADELVDPPVASRRLAEFGLLAPDAHLDDQGLRRLRATREQLRILATANTDQRPPDPAVLDGLEQLLAASPLVVRPYPGDPLEVGLTPASESDAATVVLAAVAAAVYDTVRTDTWRRVKACANDECRWLFYDGSRSRTGRWCAMRACGNLTKARAYRQRQRSDPLR